MCGEDMDKRKIEKKKKGDVDRRKRKSDSPVKRQERDRRENARSQTARKRQVEPSNKKNAKDKREKFNQYKFVIQELTAREIKRKYSRSMLGIVWSVLNPLLSMTIISLIFSHIFRRSIENFPIYYLSGSILWQLFTGATNAAMTTFVDNKQMLIKVKLPMQIFILARVYTALVNLGYSLVAYITMLFVFQVNLKITMLFIPVIVFLLLLFSLGISYMLATAYVYFGDVKHLYSVFLTLLMYSSALFYPVDQLTGMMYTVVSNNPIFNYIDALRSVVMLGALPSWSGMIRMLIWAIAMYTLGYALFKKNKNAIMQKI
jgi:ABC-type polysaccharide/polyol phosphate export systems, permease component